VIDREIADFATIFTNADGSLFAETYNQLNALFAIVPGNYRSWLDETGAPMKVQQELMRHASIQTTMNVYGQAMPESKRAANGKVVTMVLQPLRASA
jgi:integrase